MQGPGGPVEAALSRPLDGCRPQTLGYPGAWLAVLPPPRKTLANLFQCERRANGACLPDHRHLLLASSGRGVTIPSAISSVHALLLEGHVGLRISFPMVPESEGKHRHGDLPG